MSEWVAGWISLGWSRKGGAIENLPPWTKLVQAAAGHDIAWRWVRGHAGHAKNEYANALAQRAAERQERSNGLVASGFDTWLAQQRARGHYADYDPGEELHERILGWRRHQHPPPGRAPPRGGAGARPSDSAR